MKLSDKRGKDFWEGLEIWVGKWRAKGKEEKQPVMLSLSLADQHFKSMKDTEARSFHEGPGHSFRAGVPCTDQIACLEPEELSSNSA